MRRLGGARRRSSRTYLGTLLLTLPLLIGLWAASAAGATPISTGDGGWAWLDPTPQGNVLAAVTFVDADHGWAVGSAGTLIATTDGGVSWTGQVSHTAKDLEDVAFADADHGWAVGSSGTLLTTKDGGRSWRAQDAGTSDFLVAVTFAGTRDGWIVDADGDILATRDGGLNWTTRASSIGLIRDLAFIDADRGWAVGGHGAILATSDGGATWTQQNSETGYALDAVCFVDSTHGWAVGSTYWTPAVGERHPVVLATSDGGAHWTRQTVPGAQDDLALSTVSFADTSHGWTAGYGDGLLLTSDGGQTWTSQRTAPEDIEDVTFVDSERGWAVGNARILATADGGLTWTAQSGQQTGTLHAVDFADSMHGCAVGMHGFAYTTSDGGQTWADERVAGGDLDSVACVDLAHIWAAGSGLWNVVSGAQVGTSLSSGGVDFIDAAHGWAVGGNGSILVTVDGGTTWEPQVSGTTVYLTSVDFVDAEHGWAVGGSGAIIATVDGGQTWTAQASGTTVYLRGVAFADATHGWAGGDRGTIVSTRDGGATWDLQYSGERTEGAGVYGVDCTDADHAWAVGSAGTVVATTDGGAHWTPQASGTNKNLMGVDFIDATRGWIVGNDGTVLTTTTGGLPTVDVRAPVTSVSGADGLWHRHPVTLVFAAADDPGGSGMTGGPATTEHKLDGGLWTSGAGVTVQAPGDHSGDGLRTVRYRSCDAAGNCEAIRSVTVRIDTTAPTVSASAGGAWLRSAADVRLSAADAGSGVASVTYLLDGVETTVAGADAVVGVPAAPNARHTLVYRATDALGTSCAEQALSFTIDTRGPTTAAKRVGGRKGRKIALRYRLADNLSPKAKAVTVVVRTARGKEVKSFLVGTRKTTTWCSVTWVPKAKGSYRYYVYGKDLAGNPQRRVGSARVVVR